MSNAEWTEGWQAGRLEGEQAGKLGRRGKRRREG
jgi:hypothetical protein